MLTTRWCLLVAALLVALLVRPAGAQHMYLDSNADGIHDSADSLNAVGSTTVDIWLDTTQDRFGFPAVCPSPNDPTSFFSYEVILRATDGTMTWGQFTNQRTEMSLVLNASDSTDFYVAFGGTTISAPGLFHLGTLEVSVSSGEPHVDIVTASHLGPSLETAFGSECPGRDGDWTLKLGTDWFDTDGLAETPSSLEMAAPEQAQGRTGVLLTLSATATGAEGSGSISMSASGFPPSLGLSVRDSSATATVATLSGIPIPADIGHYEVLWRASDISGDSAAATTALDIIEGMQPPSIGGVRDTLMRTEGDVITIHLAAHNRECCIGRMIWLEADLSNLPSGNNATFTYAHLSPDGAAGVFTWTPGYYDNGDYTVTFTADNGLTTSKTVTIHVANAPPPAPQVPSVRLQMPGQGYRVEVLNYDEACAATGGLCSSDVYMAGDSGQVYVPLLTCGTGSCDWWDRVLILFPAWIPAAFFDGSLSPPLDLHPASRPEDRVYYNFTPPPDTLKVHVLELFRPVQAFYQERYGFSRGSLEIRLTDGGPQYGGSNYLQVLDYIEWPSDPAYFEGVQTYPERWVGAHEYVHALQYQIYGYPGECTEDQGHCGVFGLFCFSCATHYLCTGPQSQKGSWNEGTADGMAEYFYSRLYGLRTFADGPCSPNTGPEYEGSIASFVYRLSERDPRAFMDCWRYATFTMIGQGVDHATTVGTFLSLWDDRDPDPGWIVHHHPGTWNVDAIYAAIILGQSTAVEERREVLGGFGIQNICPNPGGGRVEIRLRLPSGRPWEIKVHDARGRLVHSAPVPAGPAVEIATAVDLAKLPVGLYFVSCQSEDGSRLGKARKLVVLH